MEQTGWLLEQQGLMRSDDFLAYARSAPYDYPWLADRPPGASLEGYLFPDTYELTAEATPDTLVDLMLATFDARIAPEIEGRLTGKTIFDLELGDTENLVKAVRANLLLQAQRHQAVYDYNVAMLSLLRAAGQLDAAALPGTLLDR